MNEQDFRDALRQTMTTVAPPPEMSDTAVLDAARRDVKRRRTRWAGVGSAAAVVAVAVGVAVLTPSEPDGDRVQVADQPSTSTQPGDDRDRVLAAALLAAMPAGYEPPAELKGADGQPLMKHNVVYDESTGEDAKGWAYTAAVPLKRGVGVGELSVTVFGPNEHRQGNAGCRLNPMGAPTDKCVEKTVGGKTVGVFDVLVDGRPTQHAVFQYDDTTLVEVTQSAGYRWAGLQALPDLPLSTEQLLVLVTDQRFKLQ